MVSHSHVPVGLPLIPVLLVSPHVAQEVDLAVEWSSDLGSHRANEDLSQVLKDELRLHTSSCSSSTDIAFKQFSAEN